MDDKSIVDLYFSRNQDAITQTDKKYGRYCYSIAYNILTNKEDAEESVSDTYMAAWNTIPPKRPSFLNSFGYEDNVQTICSFKMPEFDTNMNRVEPIETGINGMYGLMTDTTIAWADPERHVVYKLYSKDVTGEELLKAAQSISTE